mgnify:CR=1 FL=1
MSEATLSVVDIASLVPLFGTRDQHLRRIRERLDVRISARDDDILISGDAESVAQATNVLVELKKIVQRHGAVEPDEVERLLDGATGSVAADSPTLEVQAGGRKVTPRTPGQARYVKAIHDNDLVFCLGPAGTGKTYLAVACSVSAMRQGQVRKIVLVRPAVEAGESLGYLPGDLQAKINPYLRPLLDALREMMDYEQVKRYSEQDIIEVVPLAYMRGRTLNDSFIILDEAQNTTIAQMKMFLTRMGRNSKMVVSGDATQVDLPDRAQSGLTDAMKRLSKIEGIAQVSLTGADIVRHRLVTEIVQAYETGSRKRR